MDTQPTAPDDAPMPTAEHHGGLRTTIARRAPLVAGMLLVWGVAGGGCHGNRSGRTDDGGMTIFEGGANLDSGAPPGTGRACGDDSDCENGLICDGLWICNGEFGCERTHPPVGCDDMVTCTIDECLEPSGRCQHRGDDSRCEDDDPCSLNLCEAQGCEFPPAPDMTPCPDGLCYDGACCPGCWDGMSCQPGDGLNLCGAAGSLCEDCDDGDACTDDRCAVGTCEHDALADGSPCDGGLCSLGACCEGCMAIDGSCEPGTSLVACGREGQLCAPCACASDTCDSGACPPGVYQIDMVAAGRGHSCALNTSGNLFCWGANHFHQGGLEPDLHGSLLTGPTRVGMTSAWTMIDVNDYHGCGVQETGGERRLYCWGAGNIGQLGTGAVLVSSVPVEVAGSRTDWIQACAGSRHSCAVTVAGLLFCWGTDVTGQLGIIDSANQLSPHQVHRGLPTAAGWQQVVGGRAHTCAVRRPGVGAEREVWCWGSDSSGQVGIGDTLESIQNLPMRVAGDNWERLTAGVEHTCGIRQDGTLWCWGNNLYFQLGIGSAAPDQPAPAQVGVDTNWARVSGGTQHTCGVRTDGTLWCWGRASSFQLGLGPEVAGAVRDPTRVGTDTDWVDVDCGYIHTCGTKRDGTIYCWGAGRDGQLGLGDLSSRDTPYRVCF